MGTRVNLLFILLAFHHLALIVRPLQLYLAEQGYKLFCAISYQFLSMSAFPFYSSWNWLRFFFQYSASLPLISFLFEIFPDRLSLLLL